MPAETCPKCDYARGPGDHHVHPGICPRCGIAIAKWRSRQPDAPAAAAPPASAPDTVAASAWAARLLQVPESTDALAVNARGLLWFGLLLWAAWFMVHGIDWAVIGASFMHQINLPFHEFGHVLLAPFGRFLAILGGSLVQVALPLALAVAFVVSERDNFAASVCAWWCGQSFVDLAPYIADAPVRALPLVGGAGESSHDWGNLLDMLGWMSASQGLARGCFAWGCLLMAAALAWGWTLLRRQRASLRRSALSARSPAR